MPVFRQAKHARYIMGKCDKGADLLEELTGLCAAEGIKLGRVEALGAAAKARLAFHDQEAREYRFFELNEPLEITNLVGNVSLKTMEGVAKIAVEKRSYGWIVSHRLANWLRMKLWI